MALTSQLKSSEFQLQLPVPTPTNLSRVVGLRFKPPSQRALKRRPAAFKLCSIQDSSASMPAPGLKRCCGFPEGGGQTLLVRWVRWVRRRIGKKEKSWKYGSCCLVGKSMSWSVVGFHAHANCGWFPRARHIGHGKHLPVESIGGLICSSTWYPCSSGVNRN